MYMKKILIIISVFLFLASCEKFDELNKDKKNPYIVTGESLFTGAQKNFFDQMVSTNVNFNIFRLFAQYWTETTYIDESRYDLVTRTIPDNHWDVMYRDVLKDLKDAENIISASPYNTDPISEVAARKQNRIATIEIFSVFVWGQMVETFGDIPYTEALDINKPSPKYDDALTIYLDLISRLNAAINTLKTNYDNGITTGIEGDNMYNGNLISWMKFANSVKLKMGMILADIPEQASLSKTTVEDAVTAGVFTSNLDNARIKYMSSSPNTNPIYQDLVESERHDFVPANTLVDYMNSLDDPRREFYFTKLGDTIYKGGTYGVANSYRRNSHVADKIQEPTFEGVILDYAEVEFYLAEAAERLYSVGGTAENHYNNAIKASIQYWYEITMEKPVPDSIANNYLVNPLVAYTTATGDYKQKIGMQKWIAMYNRGFEAWTSWRMLDYPVLVKPPSALSDIPVRLTYPIEEQTLNSGNYHAASSAIHGDLVTTKLFFDKN
jgi:hypothetical protein